MSRFTQPNPPTRQNQKTGFPCFCNQRLLASVEQRVTEKNKELIVIKFFCFTMEFGYRSNIDNSEISSFGFANRTTRASCNIVNVESRPTY